MKKVKLYEIFNDWNYDGNIWIIGDPHFGDEDCKLIDPNWPSPEEQVKLINNKVHKNDTLIVLGDVGDPTWVKKLKGYKILVTGNHDKGKSNYKREELFYHVDDLSFEEIKKQYPTFRSFIDPSHQNFYCDNRMFDEVYTGPIFISPKILLSHEPVKIPFGYNIHGHSHDDVKFIYWEGDAVSYNACANVINYEPVRLEDIISEFETKDVHRLGIDKRKLKK